MLAHTPGPGADKRPQPHSDLERKQRRETHQVLENIPQFTQTRFVIIPDVSKRLEQLLPFFRPRYHVAPNAGGERGNKLFLDHPLQILNDESFDAFVELFRLLPEDQVIGESMILFEG